MGKSDTGLGSTVNGGTSNNINTVLTLVLLFGVLERVSPGVAWPWFLGTWGSMCVGFMLFHTQHANNPSFACRGNEWSAKGSALRGSSHLTVVPRWLRWVTMGIEYHHIHHLTTRIPGYRLRECHEALPANQWAQEGVLSLDWSGVWMSLGYTLFNEKLGRFV
jgi:omega-6 fatty acid desaturase (delta-12 desaturase)